MCTVIVSLDPENPVPLLLLGIRDEFTGRPWQPPARHWPGSPLIGGRDEQAGGTWLAVHPDVPRVGCILNGRGELAPEDRRRSRGDLPLRAAAEGPGALAKLHQDRDALTRYDPFYLVCATRSEVALLSWNGTDSALTGLGPGTHVLTNAGHMYPPDRDRTPPPVGPPAGDPLDEKPDGQPDGNADGQPDEKAVRFGPKFAACRPSGDPAASLTQAWADWLPLAAGDGLGTAEPGAIIVRRELPDGRIWGSTSETLVALAADGRLRYDFQPAPPDPAAWYRVDVS
jgi:Transport and Golgi organisation 2